jgi:Holliday junction resolvase
VQGRAREYQAMHELRSLGWYCTRSAMSHGPVDLIAARRGRIKLIQVKSGSARVEKLELKLLKQWAAAFRAEAQVWTYKKKGLVEKKTVFKINVIRKTVPKLLASPAMPVETLPESSGSGSNPSLLSQTGQAEILKVALPQT